ncbi:MAG: PocR ligand-binding domain-containing protein [Syntrophomonas sp.]
MKDEDKTKEQLIAELIELRQNNIAQSFSRWFSTGRPELFVLNKTGQQAGNYHIKYKFSDLVDIPFLQKLLNSFYEATGIPHGLQDENNNILSGIGWQDICTNFHRVCPHTECRCKQSDSYIAAHLHDGPFVGYKCMNGLMDFGTPIIVEGQHLASIFLGQFLHEPPDEDYFRRQAQEYGFDEAAYMEALRRVPIIPEEQVNSIMRFYSQLGQFLATMGLERKRQLEAADQALRERDERLSLVGETCNDGFWDWNIAADDLYFIPRWAKMLGYSKEELEPHLQTWQKLIHPDDISATMKAFSDHLHGQTEKFQAEYRMLTKSGDWKWVMSRGQVVDRTKEGQPASMVGINIDLTARKQVEAALVQSEKKFSKAFHCNPDLMAISTLAEGRYVEVNNAFLEITGFSRQEAIGHTAQELGIWAVPEERDNLLKLIQEQGNIQGFELDMRLKSGEIRKLCLSGEIIDIDGERHLLNSSRDITNRKRMEEALRLSQECFYKAFNVSPIIMTITTLEEGRIVKVNDAFCSITGHRQDDVIGRKLVDIGFPADCADHYLVKQMLMANQPVKNMEIGFCKYTGKQGLGLYSAELFDKNGEPCILSVIIDITELRQMEAEMARLDQLNLVGEMAASIGHEIRNPMTSVRGFLQIFKTRYIEDEDYLNLMIEELDRANLIISEFLSLAKNKVVELQPESLNEIIIKLLPLIQAQAQSRDQYVKLEQDDLPNLFLDKKEIRQLILNLVNNGLESMSAHGDVIIKTFMEEETVVLAIKDQGHGIDHELLKKLGTPFFTTKEQGTGLGLAVCYRIANRHNAKIDIETSSTGTTFYVRFPSLINCYCG